MTGKIHTIGSRAQVWHGTAKKTSGGLTKSDLMMSHGRIVSKSKHLSAKKEMRLVKYGYGTQKGKFGFVKLGSKKSRKSSRKMRGGMVSSSPASAMWNGDGNVGQGITPGGPQVIASMAGGSGISQQLTPAAAMWEGDGIAGQGITPGGPQTLAEMAGGKKRNRRMRGGMMVLSPGSAMWNGDGIDGQGITPGGPQTLAEMAGGKRRKTRSRKMRGGTTKQMPMAPTNPQNLALNRN